MLRLFSREIPFEAQNISLDDLDETEWWWCSSFDPISDFFLHRVYKFDRIWSIWPSSKSLHLVWWCDLWLSTRSGWSYLKFLKQRDISLIWLDINWPRDNKPWGKFKIWRLWSCGKAQPRSLECKSKSRRPFFLGWSILANVGVLLATWYVLLRPFITSYLGIIDVK